MLICYADNMLSNEEFLVLWENYESKIPTFLETITIRSRSKTRTKLSARQNFVS